MPGFARPPADVLPPPLRPAAAENGLPPLFGPATRLDVSGGLSDEPQEQASKTITVGVNARTVLVV